MPFSSGQDSTTSCVAPMNILKSPIEKLGPSLLQRIFLLNADMDDPSLHSIPSHVSEEDRFSYAPLIVARRTSHVCMKWREAILSCPNLWGGILDIQHLNQENNHWRYVVIRRTGGSLLSIKGTILDTGYSTPELKIFFLLLLKESWKRIRSLEVTLGLGPGFTLDNDIVNLLKGPAPNLETLKIHFIDHIVPQAFLLSRFCFTNDSPRLRHLSVTGLPFYTLAPWLNHLRSLTLTCPFTLFEILDALTLAQALEYLDLGNLVAFRGHNPHLPRPSVPRLREIIINNTFKTCITFLDHISPALECSLFMSANYVSDFTETLDDKISAARVLAGYSQRYLNAHPATSYHVHVGYDRCIFAQASDTPPPHPSFFSIILADKKLSENSVLLFLLAYSNCDLPKITTLYLGITLSAVNITDHSRAGILPFFHSFSGVRDLRVSGRDALQYLLTVCEPQEPVFPSIAFPCLTRVGIDQLDARCLGIIVHFLAWRRDLGVPIRTLHLVTSIHNELRDFSLIDLMKDLEVVWTIWDSDRAQEYTYVCGSGNIKQLHLDYYVV